MKIAYPIRAAAQATGLTVETLRAWERRYQAVNPVRVGRGRLYGEADIRRLVHLRRAIEGGRSISQVARLSERELQRLARRSASPATRRAGTRPGPDLRPFLEAVAACDCMAADHELGRFAVMLRPAELVHQVVLPLIRHAGENWEKGRWQIAHEHLVSACVRNLLGGLVRLPDSGRRAGKLLLTTPPGELHEFGILCAAMLAAGQGFQVIYLGPNLPAEEILLVAAVRSPRAVVLGLTDWNGRAAKRPVRRLAAELAPTTELWIGGSGAAGASSGISRGAILQLEDFAAFERHLVRLRA